VRHRRSHHVDELRLGQAAVQRCRDLESVLIRELLRALDRVHQDPGTERLPRGDMQVRDVARADQADGQIGQLL
jgi:hypothetical protein